MSSAFSLDETMGFQDETVFFKVCAGWVKAFEMSQVCRCEDIYSFNFCATPSVLRGNKAHREQSKSHESRKPGSK